MIQIVGIDYKNVIYTISYHEKKTKDAAIVVASFAFLLYQHISLYCQEIPVIHPQVSGMRLIIPTIPKSPRTASLVIVAFPKATEERDKTLKLLTEVDIRL